MQSCNERPESRDYFSLQIRKQIAFLYETDANKMEEIQACRACLATDVKLYDMFTYKLVPAFAMITGSEVTPSDAMPHRLCSFCAALLGKCSAFQERCRVSVQLLACAAMQGHLVTTDYLRELDRDAHGLTLPYVYKHIPVSVKEEADSELTDIFNDIIKQKDNIKIEGAASSDEETLAEIIQRTRQPRKKSKKKRIQELELIQECEITDQEYDNVSIKEEIDDDVPMKYNFDNESKVDMIFNNQVEVITLTKEEQIEELKMRMNTENYKNSFFKCDLCYKGFLMESTYKNHMERHNPSSGPLSCDICHTRWTERRALQAHTASTHARKYICRRCGQVAKSMQRARDHHKWHEGVTYVCTICRATFRKSTSYLTHIRCQHPSSHVCGVCDASYISANGLKLHCTRAHHNGKITQPNEQYQCEQCGIYLKNSAALANHISLAVNNICDNNLRPCTYCGNNFETEESLKEHVKIHKKDGPVKCLECNKQFSNARSCATHFQRIHLQIKAVYRKRADRTDVVCEICGFKCMSKSSLVYHQRIHSGEKPYQCSECSKKFSVYQRLQIHMRTHTGERPFKCARCPKAFMHKAALNRHDRVHTGAKPYSCPHCNKTFSQSNSMKIHVRGVHLKLPALYRRTALEK